MNARTPRPTSNVVESFPPFADLSDLRVLYVEDDAECRELAIELLGQSGARVAEASSVAEAVELVGSFMPDVLVSDLGLGTEDGVDLIRQVRALPPHRGGDVPAIALTGRSSHETAIDALRAGFHVHIAKPIDPWLLAQAVANVVGAPPTPAMSDRDAAPGHDVCFTENRRHRHG